MGSVDERVHVHVGARHRPCRRVWVGLGRISQYAHQTVPSPLSPSSSVSLSAQTPAAPVPSPTRRPVEFERPALLLPSTGGCSGPEEGVSVFNASAVDRGAGLVKVLISAAVLGWSVVRSVRLSVHRAHSKVRTMLVC
jgi:hypothetical protein